MDELMLFVNHNPNNILLENIKIVSNTQKQYKSKHKYNLEKFGFSISTLITVISSRASPGLIVVRLLQLYFRYPIAISKESIPLLKGFPVSLFIDTEISYGALT